MGITQYRLAKDIGVPAMRINKIVRGERGISADTALRLARYFGMSVDFWTGIQIHLAILPLELEVVKEGDAGDISLLDNEELLITREFNKIVDEIVKLT